MAETTSSNPAGSDTGLPSNVGAGICAIFTLVAGIIFYFIEKKDLFVRHWAVQGIFFGGTTLAFSIAVKIAAAIFHAIPGIGGLLLGLLALVSLLVNIAFIVLWILGVIKAFQGQRWEYPYISEQCKKLFPSLA
ncbi:MAG: DUF4870 domain-containing protein [Chthoniobacterales bacterium]